MRPGLAARIAALAQGQRQKAKEHHHLARINPSHADYHQNEARHCQRRAEQLESLIR